MNEAQGLKMTVSFLLASVLPDAQPEAMAMADLRVSEDEGASFWLARRYHNQSDAQAKYNDAMADSKAY